MEVVIHSKDKPPLRRPTAKAPVIGRAMGRVTGSSRILGNGDIRSLATNPTAIAEFPFLRTIAELPPQKNCGCRSGDRTTSQAYQAARTAIATLAPEKGASLKRMLGAAQLVVHFSVGGKPAQKTI